MLNSSYRKRQPTLISTFEKATDLDLGLVDICREVRYNDFLRRLWDSLCFNSGCSDASTLGRRWSWLSKDLSTSSASTTRATTGGFGLGGDELQNVRQTLERRVNRYTHIVKGLVHYYRNWYCNGREARLGDVEGGEGREQGQLRACTMLCFCFNNTRRLNMSQLRQNVCLARALSENYR